MLREHTVLVVVKLYTRFVCTFLRCMINITSIIMDPVGFNFCLLIWKIVT
jgi:hypothetical protein